MRELPANDLAEPPAPPVADPAAAGTAAGKPAADPFAPPPHGFGTAGSLASTCRYASAVQSTDSDTFSEHAAAYADPAAPPGGSLPPTATGSPASTPGGDSAANRQLWSPSKRPQGQPGYAHLPPAPPHAGFGGAALGTLPPPPGVDPTSYQAGERAAFMLAFQQALPGQQALGQLFSAVDSLHSRLEEEVAAWRSTQLGASKADGLLQAALQRLDALEHNTLPQLQDKWEEAARRAPEQLAELVGSLSQVVSLLAAQRELLLDRQAEPLPAGARGAARRQLPWLLIAAAGYAQAALSRADVAALFLSRKILLTDPAPGEEAQGMRSALGAALFVAAVEAAWQAQRRLLRPLPSAAHRAAAPLQLGLKVARAAVWTAALLLAAAQTRQACRRAGDRACSAVEAAAAALGLSLWQPLLQRWLPQRKQALQLEDGCHASTRGCDAAAVACGDAGGSPAAGQAAGAVPSPGCA